MIARGAGGTMMRANGEACENSFAAGMKVPTSCAAKEMRCR